ncbi:hypothetical protein RHMOL_Rhmol01G0237700 [Rhododendron molle]|uniref:Uncharacterized protein n=1 Tax=Rhododendron molle TaxID=49168 RepID=A0ACC0Q578_RHOML|nr:hypothetical protein RHMOL_Rhmol01G0237700 [Rhododendron molle]
MADHGDRGSGGEVVDHPEDRGGPMEAEIGEQKPVEAVAGQGAEVADGGDGGQGREQETSGEEVCRATEEEPRATEQGETVGSSSEPKDPGMVTEGPPIVDRSSGGAEGSGAVGENPEPSQTLPRDSAKGKGVVIEAKHAEEVQIEREQTTEATTVEIREDIAFRPPVGAATSSRHVPITYDDIAEHAPDEILARVLEKHPEIGEYVLKAKEDRAKAIEAAEAAARAERDRVEPEGLTADVEAEERDAEEALGPRVSAVAEAGAMKRPEFSEEIYTLPRPHLFVPSGFAGYKPPQQTDYDLELMLRDPGVQIANTWAETRKGGECRQRRRESRPVVGGPPKLLWKVDVVDHQGNPTEVELVPARIEPAAVTVPVEWVNEAIRRMLALENVVRRAAQGMPLQLRYPAPAAQPAQAAASRRTQAQGRAASRKRARSPPRAQTTTPSATTRHTRSSRPAVVSKETAKKAAAHAEERLSLLDQINLLKLYGIQETTPRPAHSKTS